MWTYIFNSFEYISGRKFAGLNDKTCLFSKKLSEQFPSVYTSFIPITSEWQFVSLMLSRIGRGSVLDFGHFRMFLVVYTSYYYYFVSHSLMTCNVEPFYMLPWDIYLSSLEICLLRSLVTFYLAFPYCFWWQSYLIPFSTVCSVFDNALRQILLFNLITSHISTCSFADWDMDILSEETLLGRCFR